MAITPKQAADAMAEVAAAKIANDKAYVKLSADGFDLLLETRLRSRNRAVVGRHQAPADADALALTASFPGVLEEIERRYREAGWTTKLESDVLTIDPPPTP